MQSDIIDTARTLSQSFTSPGPNGLPYALYHILPELAEGLQQVIAAGGDPPHSWSEANVRLLPKTGSLHDLGNWRPISLLNTDYKIYTRMITDRLQALARSCIPDEQTAFIRGRQLQHGAALLRCLLDTARLQPDGDWCLVNMDQSKAYHRVSWAWLQDTLHQYGLSPSPID